MGRAAAVFMLVVSALAATSLAARATGFVVDVDALGAFPVGTLASGRGVGDLLDTGYGVRAELLYEVAGRFSAGLSVSGLSHSASVPIGAILADANLTAVPVHALARLHTPRAGGFAYFAEAGIGIAAWNLNPVGTGLDTRTQTTFSFGLGAGASYLLSRRWDVRAGAQYQQALTGSGQVWERGDDPKFVVLSLGAHFQY
jgi:opacity protein-like surface antigen